MDTQVADSLLGATVDGRYRIRGLVARGGMATVYTATDERLERTVAIKIVHPSQSDPAHFPHRFIDEAKTIARLTHPNVVTVYDQGTHEGLPYLVMEYVPGRTLRDVLASRRRLAPTEALAIIEQMLSAIAAAHREGLVHRDIKPENVLVAESPSGGHRNLVDCVVKVADFGLAQAVQASADDGSGLMATVAYVAPELVEHGRADPRSDVYSTGIVLFEMLTGRVPYDTGRPAEVAWQHVERDVPPPSAHVPGLPPVLDDLVARTTRRDPRARPTDAGMLLAEVQATRERLVAVAAREPAADSTVVMRAVPAAERPAWARLPAPKAVDRRPAVTRRAASGGPPGRAARRGQAPGNRRLPLIAAGVALVLLVALGAWWFGVGRWMPAPDLLTKPQDQAVAEAQRAGLDVAYGEARYSDEVPEGHVLAQDPARHGRVLRGGTVTLTLSLGPQVVAVPDVVGVPVDVAERQLAELGLEVVHGEPAYSNTVPAGRVLTLEPPVGTEVDRGERVTIAASRGRAPVDVPDLIGLRVEDATRQLQRLQLEVRTVEVQNDKPAGEVVGQDPGSGAGLEEGDTVTLEVSEGPPTRPVPDVINRRCQDAVQVLEDAGFAANIVIGARGRVTVQFPSAGTGLRPGSEVDILCAG